MKIYIHSNTEPIMAMATINPQLCKQSSIRVEVVQGGEGPNPHVHVYCNDGKVAYVSLTKAEYADHHDDCPALSKVEKKEFIKIMNTLWKKQWIEINILDNNKNPTGETKVVNATGYEAAVQIWCDTYGGEEKFKYDAEGRPVIPDYRLL